MRSRAALTRRTLLKTAAASAADHRNRRHRAAVAELRAGPGADHPRRAIGRRVDRFRRGLGARRPSLADAGRGRDHRQLPRHQERGVRRCAAGNRFHRQGADRRPAAGPGHLLSHQLPGSVLGRVRRGADRALPHAVERTALGLVPVVGRHDGPGLGHRRGARRHAHLRHHAQQSARLLHPLRRQHLCRLPDRRGKETARRRRLAQHRHRGEIETGRNARRLSRQLQIQSARRQSARVQRRGADICAVGQSRSDGDVVAGRSRCRTSRPARRIRSSSPRAPAAPFTNSCRCARPWPSPAASIARCRYGPLLDVFMLDMRSYRGPDGPHTDRISARRLSARAATSRLAQARARALAGDLESDRRRYPIGYVVNTTGIEQADGPRGRGLEIAELLSFIKHAGIRNTLWLTADLHYTAAHYYDPNRAVFQDFEPFWEFVSGPTPCRDLDAGADGRTFGPQVVFHKASKRGAGRQPRAVLRAAILRPCGDRRRDRSADRDAQGRRGSRAVVDHAATPKRAYICAVARPRMQLSNPLRRLAQRLRLHRRFRPSRCSCVE